MMCVMLDAHYHHWSQLALQEEKTCKLSCIPQLTILQMHLGQLLKGCASPSPPLKSSSKLNHKRLQTSTNVPCGSGWPLVEKLSLRVRSLCSWVNPWRRESQEPTTSYLPMRQGWWPCLCARLLWVEGTTGTSSNFCSLMCPKASTVCVTVAGQPVLQHSRHISPTCCGTSNSALCWEAFHNVACSPGPNTFPLLLDMHFLCEAFFPHPHILIVLILSSRYKRERHLRCVLGWKCATEDVIEEPQVDTLGCRLCPWSEKMDDMETCAWSRTAVAKGYSALTLVLGSFIWKPLLSVLQVQSGEYTGV